MTDTENKCTPEQERENRFKAIELNVESLKQYITLSTVSIAGLLAYYSSTDETSSLFLFISIGLFSACAIVSVYNINLFINKVNKNEINVRVADARKANFLAIGLFVLAIISASIFFFNSKKKSGDVPNEHSNIILKNQNIVIGKDVKTKVYIRTDSTGNKVEITINK
jgi:hypothetical protein